MYIFISFLLGFIIGGYTVCTIILNKQKSWRLNDLTKLTKVFGLMALVAVFFFNSMAFAAGTVTQVAQNFPDSDRHIKKLIFLCTGDAATGSIPNTASNTSNTSFIKGMRLFQVEVAPTPGGTAPDAADVFILDADSMDLLGSIDGSTTAYRGLNLIHATLKRATTPDIFHAGQNAHADYYPLITGALTLKVANQATASANWTIILTFIK
jgi:hypothetical protein